MQAPGVYFKDSQGRKMYPNGTIVTREGGLLQGAVFFAAMDPRCILCPFQRELSRNLKSFKDRVTRFYRHHVVVSRISVRIFQTL